MIELKTEVVVVGSGFGGSIAASRLVEQGIAVILLERGPWRNTVPVNSMNVREHTELPRKSFGNILSNGLAAVCHHRWLWGSGIGINRRRGTFELHFNKGFTSVATNQVGGGSLIWGGLVDRPLDNNYWDNVADGVSEEIIAPHFERVKDELGVHSVNGHGIDFPPSLLDTLHNDENFDLSVNADVTVAHNLTDNLDSTQSNYGVERKTSKLKESLSLGCLDGSKASTDAIYLASALAKGLKIFSQCEVRSVEQNSDGGYCVYARHHAYKKTIKISCKKLIMAAGSYHTVRLLLEAQRDKKLQHMEGLGKGIGVNGDEMSILLNTVISEQEENCTGLFTNFTMKNGNKSLLHGFINPDLPWPGSKLMRRLLAPVLRSSILVCMGEDIANGQAVLKKGRIEITYSPRKYDINRIAAQENDSVAKILGKKSITFRKTVTAHIFGGARVAQAEKDGVVDGYGECHQNTGLYIVDGAAIPKAPGRPPSLNIAAWASHVAQNIISGCDANHSTTINVDIDRIIGQANAPELALLFKLLPVTDDIVARPSAGNWKISRLTPESVWLKRTFNRLFCKQQSVDLTVMDAPLKKLKPKLIKLNCPILANSWDGSGLVYQMAIEVMGKRIAIQMRKLPDLGVWLLRSADEQQILGWHLLTK